LFTTLIKNLRLFSYAEAGIALNLFVNFEQKRASYSYKIVLIKNYYKLIEIHCLGILVFIRSQMLILYLFVLTVYRKVKNEIALMIFNNQF